MTDIAMSLVDSAARPAGHESQEAPALAVSEAKRLEVCTLEVEAQLQQPDFRLRLQDWKGGERVWIVDVAGPPQAAVALIEKLKEDLFAGREVKVRPGALPVPSSQISDTRPSMCRHAERIDEAEAATDVR